MRYGPDDKFWVVVDAAPESTLPDILFQASLHDLERQFKGGLTMDEHPTLFTDEREAEVEAYGRLVAQRAAQAIARLDAKTSLRDVTHIELLDADGNPIFQAELPTLDD